MSATVHKKMSQNQLSGLRTAVRSALTLTSSDDFDWDEGMYVFYHATSQKHSTSRLVAGK